MKLLSEKNIKNSKVIMRVDFNVPISQGHIKDKTRILNVLPTIKYLIKNNNTIVLISHLGRPDGTDDKLSLRIVYKELSKMLETPVFFTNKSMGLEFSENKKMLKPGDLLLMENIRFYSEEKIAKDKISYQKNILFAKELAQHMDFFINEAFACSHRESTSMTLLPQCFPNKTLAGFLLEKEVSHLTKIKYNSLSPFTAIIGGAKISTKIKLIEKLLIICDNIILGGAMAHTFIVFLKGQIGSSLFEPNQVLRVEKILKNAEKYNCKIHLPLDCVTTTEISNNTITNIRNIKSIPKSEMSVDIGPVSVGRFNEVIMKSKKILWNGPMGIFEFESFANGTKSIANSIHKATQLGAYSVIGGGDSISAINSFNQDFQFSYLSTGGGAMLEFFEKESLPAIKSMEY
tara:strand:- start:875 stop:2083 length:1209 start_codon:yes stop_codon:yes gene_type:complete